MANPTYDALTSTDVRGVMKHPEDMWPVGTTPHVFSVHQGVLIWYFRDKRWYMGKVVHSRASVGVVVIRLDSKTDVRFPRKLYQIEFNVDGPRIRDWYHPLYGNIVPDNPHFRGLLRAHGGVIVTRDPSPRPE